MAPLPFLTPISDQDRLFVMYDVILYRIDAAKNMWRYYRLDLQPDLFGLWLLVKEWGRVGQHGQTRVTSFSSVEEASLALQRQRDAKQKRGYVPQAR